MDAATPVLTDRIRAQVLALLEHVEPEISYGRLVDEVGRHQEDALRAVLRKLCDEGLLRCVREDSCHEALPPRCFYVLRSELVEEVCIEDWTGSASAR